MNNRERFKKLMAFEPVDRMPVLEWAPWWDKTVERWHGEGLPADVDSNAAVRDYFGQDQHRHLWFRPNTPPHDDAIGVIKNADDYHELKPTLFDELPFTDADLERFGQAQAEGAVC